MPMSINRTSPVVLEPGAGESLSLMEMTVTFKTTGKESNGQFTVMEVTETPGYASPVQWHKQTTVIAYVLEGVLTLHTGDETHQLGAGGYACAPPGTVYGVVNQGNVPVRYLLVYTPSWIEEYIAEGIDMVKREPSWPPADMSKFFAMRARYDVHDPPVD